MQRGQLFRTPPSQRARVRYIREFLDWVYSTARTPQWIEGAFWDCFLVAAPDPMREMLRAKRKSVRRATASWDWPAMQTMAREGFESVVEGRDPPGGLNLTEIPRALSTWTGPDDRRYLHYGSQAITALNEADILRSALDEALCDLRGLAVEALGRCEQCGRYFVRLRAARKRFCSPRCTWRAFHARRVKEAGRRRRRAVGKAKR